MNSYIEIDNIKIPCESMRSTTNVKEIQEIGVALSRMTGKRVRMVYLDRVIIIVTTGN